MRIKNITKHQFFKTFFKPNMTDLQMLGIKGGKGGRNKENFYIFVNLGGGGVNQRGAIEKFKYARNVNVHLTVK